MDNSGNPEAELTAVEQGERKVDEELLPKPLTSRVVLLHDVVDLADSSRDQK